MTAKMTDGQIDAIVHRVTEIGGTFEDHTREIFRSAERIYLPQIQQLQGDIERLKEFEIGYTRQAELLTSSIAREDDLDAKIAYLTAKHERLVKISEDILNAMVKDDVDDMFEAEKELRKLLTESEDGK